MMSNDTRATEEQYRRIRAFLCLARQFSLLRQFMDEWHAAETDDDRLTITRWWAAVIAPEQFEIQQIDGGDHAA
jgi:hypothetical protein